MLTCQRLLTYSRNFQDTPIDGIFATPSIHLQAGGYLAFGEGPGVDHRALWLDISYQVAFGHSAPAMGQSNARRLTCEDPRIRQRYNELFRRFVQQHRLDLRAFNLQTQIQGSLTSNQQSKYEGITTLRTQGMSMATQGCHNLQMGEVEWNPELPNLRAGHLSTTDAWYALTHTINRTVEYPVMTTYLSKAQCEKIMRPFLNSGLSVSWAVRSIPRAVVWGPLRYQGLGIRHLYTTQGVEHLLAILRHGTRETITGQLYVQPWRNSNWKSASQNPFCHAPSMYMDHLPLAHG
jgi:hypothetical protein